jgi:hypothetical protein
VINTFDLFGKPVIVEMLRLFRQSATPQFVELSKPVANRDHHRSMPLTPQSDDDSGIPRSLLNHDVEKCRHTQHQSLSDKHKIFQPRQSKEMVASSAPQTSPNYIYQESSPEPSEDVTIIRPFQPLPIICPVSPITLEAVELPEPISRPPSLPGKFIKNIHPQNSNIQNIMVEHKMEVERKPVGGGESGGDTLPISSASNEQPQNPYTPRHHKSRKTRSVMRQISQKDNLLKRHSEQQQSDIYDWNEIATNIDKIHHVVNRWEQDQIERDIQTLLNPRGA